MRSARSSADISKKVNMLFVVFVSLITCCYSQVYLQPEQVHLAMGADATEMVVSWSTKGDTASIVQYGIMDRITMVAKGNSTQFVDGGPMKATQYIHRVTLSQLKPHTRYIYRCGSTLGWSDEFFFNSLNTSSEWSPRFAVYGDLGNKNAQSLPRLQQEVQAGLYDMILHIGDFAYDMDTNNAQVGDEFMKQIEPIAAYAPYMTTVGNHENAYNFSNYWNRFSMPGGDGHSNFYSIDVGPAHFIGFSTEFLFYTNYGTQQIFNQYRWLEKELQRVSQPEFRAKRPWLITMAHRPMYCSTTDNDDCDKHDGVVRTGIPSQKVPGLEDLFYKYGVDLELWAHEHVYERLWPLYNYTVYNGSMEKPYTNPEAPVHIITGSAGCQEFHSGFQPVKPEWSAFRNSDYGYTRMTILNGTHLFMEQLSDDKGCQERHDTFQHAKPDWSALRNSDYGYTRITVHNSTHVYMEQVSDDKGGAIVDSFWMIKDHHGPYTKRRTHVV